MSTTGEWWERFFHGPWGDWQAAGFGQKHTSTEADFLVDALGLAAGDEVLDIACGTGRHAIDLAGRGIRVTGIDFNASALQIAAGNAARCELAPEFIKQDMRCLRYRDSFDAAYCFWTSFGYFEDESHDLVVAKRIAEALRPGGRFLLDVVATETLFPIFEQHLEEWLDESHTHAVHHDIRWDFETSRIEADWTFVDNGSTRTSHSSLRLYSYRELCDLLREAGFRRFEGFDTISGKPFTLGAKRLALVASV